MLTTVSGNWWSGPFDAEALPVSVQRHGTPKGYHRLLVDVTDMCVSFKAAGRPDSYQMRIMLEASRHGPREGFREFRPGQLYDDRINEDQVAAASIVVNVFDGGAQVDAPVPGQRQ